MGFLTGLFQSLMLTRTINQKQHRLTQVLSRIRRVQKESSALEKSISNQLRGQQQQARYDYMSAMNAFNDKWSADHDGLQVSQITDSTLLAQYTTSKNTYMNELQTYMQANISQAEEEAEMMKEIYLEQLKDEESDLEIEKEQLEAQIQFYQQWKEGCQKDYQASIKNFKPLGSGSSYG